MLTSVNELCNIKVKRQDGYIVEEKSMKIEDLSKLKEKVENLHVNEKKQRDLYLKDLSTGKIQGPLTGYPSIDKTWLKYVDLEKQQQERQPKTVYQEIRDNNINNANKVAIEFFGKKIKYKKLFKKVDEFAKAFIAQGIKKGDFVTMCCAGIPEMVYSFYALSKIGATVNFMAPFFDHNQMAERIKDCDSKLMIVMDTFYKLIKPAIEKIPIQKIVVIPTLNSSALKYLKKQEKVEGTNIIKLNEFLQSGKTIDVIEEAKYVPEMPLALVYSSGSTGASKAILLSNDSFQNSIHSYEACGIDLSDKQKFYQIIPPWFSTGLSTSIHLPLANGVIVFMDPRFDRKVFVKNIIKHKINTTVAPTSMYEGFLDKGILKNGDLSHLSNPFQGGEALKKETKEAVEAIFKQHGSKSALKIGYGQCECGAGIATQTDDFYRSDGSVGIPIPGVVCAIMDNQKNELQYNKRGEILVCTKSGMVEYYKNEKATSEYFYEDKFGVKWSCTGDIGYIDEEGNLFVQGRKSDYSIVNGKQIYNFDIESIILLDEAIKNVDVLSKNGNGNEYVVHLILTDDFIEKLNTNPELLKLKVMLLQKKIFEQFEDTDYIPTIFKVRKEFPIAKSGKRDLGMMENETEGFECYEKQIV